VEVDDGRTPTVASWTLAAGEETPLGEASSAEQQVRARPVVGCLQEAAKL